MAPPVTERNENDKALEALLKARREQEKPKPMLSHPPVGKPICRDEAGRGIYQTPVEDAK